MGSGLSVDKAKNATETLNESTLNQVKKSEISCAQKVEQFQNNELENIKTGGGDLTINQYSGIVSNCVLESKSQEQLINDIAAEVAQKIKTDKGAAAAFSLVSVNEQENTNKISQVLKQNYSDIAGLKCDIDVLQSQQNKLRNIDTGGGSISLSQGSNVQSDCSLIASVNRTVANSFASSTDQSSETKIPSIILYVVAGIVAISILAIISGLIYAYAGEDAPERRRRFGANFTTSLQQPYVDPYAQQPLLAEQQYVDPAQQYVDQQQYIDPSQVQLQ